MKYAAAFFMLVVSGLLAYDTLWWRESRDVAYEEPPICIPFDNLSPQALANTLDKTVSVSGTPLIIKVPSIGFYGHGLDIQQLMDGDDRGVRVNTKDDFPSHPPQSYPGLSVHAVRDDSRLTLVEYVKSRGSWEWLKTMIGEDGGRVVNYGGHDYFLYTISEGPVVMYAVSKHGGWVYDFQIIYSAGGPCGSMRSHNANLALFRDMLTNASYGHE